MLNDRSITGSHFKNPKFVTYIPTDLCAFAIRKKFIRPVQVYTLLKSLCDGRICLTTIYKKKIAGEIGLTSVKAVNNNINLLRKRNWLVYDKLTRCFFIRGYDRVMQIEQLENRTRAEFHLKDIRKLKAFLIGAVIAKLVKHQKWRKTRGPERSKGRSKPSSRDRQIYYPVANLALSKILGISISTAFEFKKVACKAGYITIKKVFRPYSVGGDTVKAKYKNDIKEAYPEIAHVVRVKGGFISLQLPDLLHPNIRLKGKRKKSKHTTRVIEQEKSISNNKVNSDDVL